MIHISNTICELSMLGTVLFLIAYFITRTAKKFHNSSWIYFMWIIVLLRFIVPIYPEWNLNRLSSFNHSYSYSFEETQTPQTNFTTKINHQKPTDDFIKPIEKNAETNQVKIESEKKEFPLNFIICSIWTAGFCIVLILHFYNLFRFCRWLRKYSFSVKDMDTLAIYNYCKKNMRIKRKIGIYYNTEISTPMLTGFLNPCIYIPENIDKNKLTYVLQHELTHYKSGDLMIKFFMNLSVLLHWFNPCIYFLRKEINLSCELHCDSIVIKKIDSENRKIYGNLLIETAENSICKNTRYGIALYKDKITLKERLSEIMNYKKVTKKRKIAVVFTCAALTVISMISGAVFAEGTTVPCGEPIEVVDIPVSISAEITPSTTDEDIADIVSTFSHALDPMQSKFEYILKNYQPKGTDISLEKAEEMAFKLINDVYGKENINLEMTAGTGIASATECYVDMVTDYNNKKLMGFPTTFVHVVLKDDAAYQNAVNNGINIFESEAKEFGVPVIIDTQTGKILGFGIRYNLDRKDAVYVTPEQLKTFASEVETKSVDGLIPYVYSFRNKIDLNAIKNDSSWLAISDSILKNTLLEQRNPQSIILYRNAEFVGKKDGGGVIIPTVSFRYTFEDGSDYSINLSYPNKEILGANFVNKNYELNDENIVIRAEDKIKIK